MLEEVTVLPHNIRIQKPGVAMSVQIDYDFVVTLCQMQKL